MREKDFGLWQEYTWSQYAQHVVRLAAGLASLGFQPGDPLLIMGDNRPYIYFGTLAAQLLRGMPCPVYADAIPREIAYVASSVHARFALAEDQEQVDKFLDLEADGGSDGPRLEYILYDDPRGLSVYDDPRLISCAEVEERGRQFVQQHPDFADQALAAVQPDDLAILLHSSGTTGLPKGVPLTHRQVLAAVRNGYAAGYFQQGEALVAYLPVAWVGDFVFSVATAAALRFVVNIPERQETVLRDLREIGPTLYFAPPRNWDQMLTHVQVRMEESTPLKRALYNFWMPLAVRIEQGRLRGERPSFARALLRVMGELFVYGPIKDYLGLSRVQRAYTAGEAIGEDTFVFFRALGVNLKQFYGQTENAALTAAQADDEVKLNTVGRPLPGVDVRIADDGEILIRSDSLMDGYYENPEATAEAFVDGWFRTGDAGLLDEDGHLIILGRVEEVVTTAAGVRFVPQYIENQLKFSPYIKEAAVMGKDRPHLAAIVCIDMEAVGHWAETNGVAYTTYADLSQKAEVYELVRHVVGRVNERIPSELAVRRFVNLHKEFDADDGELTRTRKLRRNVIDERYREVIDALYGNERHIEVAASVVYEDGSEGVIRRDLQIWDVGEHHGLSG